MPSAEPDPALDPARVGRFRGDLERLSGPADGRRIGVALSGGPDSCALLLLAAAALPGGVRAMTVDHGLRVEATGETAAAATLCAALNVPHTIAGVTVARDGTGIQAAARHARYAALADWAEHEHLDAILTAHHADDQAETVLMRLARGSGLGGLAGIRAARRLPDASRHTGLRRYDDGKVPLLLRPLLGWRKAELEAIVAAAGIVPARDPSNHDPRYDRTAARALLASADWIDTARISASASHLAEAETALATIADERYRIEDEGGDIVLQPDPLNEIARRHLRRLLAERFGAHPTGPSLEFALRLLRLGQTTTCADILCRPGGDLWRFRPAPPRQRSKRSF